MLMKCGSKSVDVTCLMNRIRDNAAVTCLSAQFFIFELFLLPISYVLKTISLNMFFFFFFKYSFSRTRNFNLWIISNRPMATLRGATSINDTNNHLISLIAIFFLFFPSYNFLVNIFASDES